MNIGTIPVRLVLIVVAVGLAGCSSTSREPRKPTVAILINAAPGNRPSPDDVALVHRTLQPEIEKHGYVLAKSSRSTDYFVHVRLPFDPLSVGRMVFERAEPTVPFIRSHETDEERRRRENKATVAEMVREPK